MAIRVLSLDFDGCLFHRGYMQDPNVITANRDFLQRLKAENSKFDQVITMVGSNRQSWFVDILNAQHRGSCFPAIQRITNYLQCELDRFLMADIYGDLPGGLSFERALEAMQPTEPKSKGVFETLKSYVVSDTREESERVKHHDWVFDETKMTILYAQMHKIANEHPDQEIVFEFYDDRGLGMRTPHDILEYLNGFFCANSALIPSNVTLRLHHYAGENKTFVNSIQGQGVVDTHYRQTVKEFASLCPQQRGMINTARDLDLGQCHNRNFRINLQCIKQEAATLRQWSDAHLQAHPEHVDNDYAKAATSAELLHHKITKLHQQLINRAIDIDTFKQDCQAAIDVARPTLEKQLGWSSLLYNLTCAVLGLGVIYVAAVATNRVVNGRYLFFPTTSASKLDAMVNHLQHYRVVTPDPETDWITP